MPPGPEWHASVAEPVIDPERPIVDPHHHLWERSGMDYLLEDLWADTGSGHNVERTVFVECRTSYRLDGPEELRPVGETEFVAGIAVDSQGDAEAVTRIAKDTDANLAIDLQENYRLSEIVAPHVAKLRYNPGHLYHHEREKPWQDKVRGIVDQAAEHRCAIRVGVNCGSVDPDQLDRYSKDDSISPMLDSAWEHCDLLDSLGFTNYCVSLKDSDPQKVIEVNRRFAERRPDVPLHLGVTEAGLPPDGVIKTRIAFEQLVSQGLGDTIRVSLTVPNDRKSEEIVAGRQILADIAAGRVRTVVDFGLDTLNIISCPSCSRVENEAFVELAEQVREMTEYAREHALTIAVMGCRVNGPGETDDADLGLWCAPNFVNLKQGEKTLGAFPYDEILDKLKQELDRLIAERSAVS